MGLVLFLSLFFVPLVVLLVLLVWLSLAAAAIEAATPPGRVHKFGSFLSSAPITPSASLRVTGLSEGNFELASCQTQCNVLVIRMM